MTLTKIALLGANGTLGAPTLDALVAADKFTITVLRRASSSSVPAHADKVSIVSIPDDAADWTLESLRAILQGQDVVLTCIRLRDLNQHLLLAEAAAAAGVKRYFPADWGSVDSTSPRARQVVPLFEKKNTVRAKLDDLAAAGNNNEFTWTSIVGGHFFDWGLREGFLHLDLDKCEAEILDDGDMRSSLTTLAQYGRAVISVLEREEQTANRALFIQSFLVSQNECLRALEKATGTEWTVKRFGSEGFIRDHKVKADAGDLQAVEDLVFALGAVDGNWEEKEGFAMELLGLREENLDEVVRRVVGERQRGC